MALHALTSAECRSASPRSFTHFEDAELLVLVSHINGLFAFYDTVSANSITEKRVAASMRFSEQTDEYQEMLMVKAARLAVLEDKIADARSEGLGQRYGFTWDETTIFKSLEPLAKSLSGAMLRHGVSTEYLEGMRPPPAALSRTADRGLSLKTTDAKDYPEFNPKGRDAAPTWTVEGDGR